MVQALSSSTDRECCSRGTLPEVVIDCSGESGESSTADHPRLQPGCKARGKPSGKGGKTFSFFPVTCAGSKSSHQQEAGSALPEDTGTAWGQQDLLPGCCVLRLTQGTEQNPPVATADFTGL